MQEIVRVAATSDLHGELGSLAEEVGDADILVIAGDIQNADYLTLPEDYFIKSFFPLIKSLKCQVVATPGNHDFWLRKHLNQYRPKVKFPKNFHLLVDEGIELCGLKFYGTPWVPRINGLWAFERDDGFIEEFKMIPAGIDVLITHTPPRIDKAQIDVSLEWSEATRRHFGSYQLYRTIEEMQPKVNICGHIHSGAHSPAYINNTMCLNASRVNESYNVAYKLLQLEFRGGQVELKSIK